MQGNLPDGDDYMYLAQLRDWLSGQSWYDAIQHRLDPNNNVPIEFSKITMMPMAISEILFQPLLGETNSAILMAALWPPILLASLMKCLSWSAEPLMDSDYARLTSYLLLFATYLLYQFSPGHIDHHGLTALLVLCGFGFCIRIILNPNQASLALLAGLSLGSALVVGLEIIPMLIVISSWIGLWSMSKGKQASQISFVYGLALLVSSAAFLLATIAPSRWSNTDPLGFSVVYIVFAAAQTLCFAGIALAAKTKFDWLRWTTGISLVLILGITFFYYFPSLITGPYGAMNKELANFMFSIIPEAMPIFKPNVTLIEVFVRLLWPVMALAACIWHIRQNKNNSKRWAWGLAFACLIVPISLAAFYQIRFMVFAQLFSIIPLTALLPPTFAWIKRNSDGRFQALLEIEALFLIAPLPMLFIPALIDSRPFNTGIILFPVASAEYSCDMQSAAETLNNISHNHPQIIMNDIAYGPELLFRTKDIILSAPFHTDVSGNLDAKKFFSATNLQTARDVLSQSKAHFVILCRKTASLYDNKGHPEPKTLARNLEMGIVPNWLVPLHYKDEKDFLLYEVSDDKKL